MLPLPPKPPTRGMEAFASRDFRRYQLARVAVILGAGAQSVAVAWQVYSISHRPMDMGYTGLALFPGLRHADELTAESLRRKAAPNAPDDGIKP